MSRASIIVIASCLAAAFAGRAEAQSIPSPYRYIEEGQEAGAFVGYLSPDRGRFGLGPAPALAYGGRYQVELAGPIALEGVLTIMPTTRDVVNPARDEGDRVIDEAEVALVVTEARLRFALTGRRTWNSVQPYLFLGGGLAFDAQGAQAEEVPLEPRDRFDFGTRFVGSAGGGGRFVLTDRLTLRLEGQLALWKLGIPDGWRDASRGFENVPEDEWTSGSGVTLGLAWRW